MAQDNREYLSKEKLQYELLAAQKRAIPMLALTFPITVALLSLCGWLGWASAPTGWWLWGWFFVLAACFTCSWIIGIVRLIAERCLIKRSKFHVEIDYVRKMNSDRLTMSEIFYRVWCVFCALFEGDWIMLVGLHERDNRYVYFFGKRRAPISQNARDFAGTGDAFYLVVLNNRRGRIVRIYNCKTYRLEE